MNESGNFSLLAVLGFWWIFLGFFNQLNRTSGIASADWSTFCAHELIAILALMLSMLVAFYLEYKEIALRRALILYELQPQEHLGLVSSLGSAQQFLPCPWVEASITKSLDFDSAKLLLWLKTSQLKASSEVINVISQMQIDYPLHANAMLNCLNLMAQQPLCPAYHGLKVENDSNENENPAYTPFIHGNTTLIEHSMQVCMHGLELAHGFVYQGIRGEYNKIAKRNDSFELPASDPMIPLICLAHDMGKLITFKRGESGKVIRVQGLHGQVGARALAQSHFIKTLSMEDQSALIKVLQFYHHPLDFTLDMDAKIESDRQAALMMLLIKADHRSSTQESRQASKNIQISKPM